MTKLTTAAAAAVAAVTTTMRRTASNAMRSRVAATQRCLTSPLATLCAAAAAVRHGAVRLVSASVHNWTFAVSDASRSHSAVIAAAAVRAAATAWRFSLSLRSFALSQLVWPRAVTLKLCTSHCARYVLEPSASVELFLPQHHKSTTTKACGIIIITTTTKRSRAETSIFLLLFYICLIYLLRSARVCANVLVCVCTYVCSCSCVCVFCLFVYLCSRPRQRVSN